MIISGARGGATDRQRYDSQPTGLPGRTDQALDETASAEAAPAGTTGLLPRHQPSYAEVAGIAAFIASDWARTITAREINLTGGVVIE